MIARTFALVALHLLLAAGAAADPATIVSFSWRLQGQTDAQAAATCAPTNCSPNPGCTSNPVPGFDVGGTLMVTYSTIAEARTQCVTPCTCCSRGPSGAGYGRSTPTIFQPNTSASSTTWTFGSRLDTTATAQSPAAGDTCVSGFGSGYGWTRHRFILVFDVNAPGARLTLSRQHTVSIIDAGGTIGSLIELTSASTGAVYSQSLSRSAAGSQDGSGTSALCLPAGRYTMNVEATSTSSFFSSSGSGGGSAQAQGQVTLQFQPYTAASITTQPDSLTICPSRTATFTAAAGGTNPALRWQWRPTAADAWTDILLGANQRSGQSWFTATSPLLASCTINPSPGYQSWGQPSIQLRCTAVNDCGAAATDPATLTIGCSSRADVAGLGGSTGCDGQLTPDDVVAFLAAFFANNLALADLVGLGGAGGPDSAITVDDLVAFLDLFFTGC